MYKKGTNTLIDKELVNNICNLRDYNNCIYPKLIANRNLFYLLSVVNDHYYRKQEISITECVHTA